ncbi:S24/S26 family peptidase [Pseudomonadota bacterium]
MQFEVLKSFAKGGPLTVVVNGECMQKHMPDGARLNVQTRRAYWPGDALAFKRGDGTIVCHRFLGYIPGRNGWRVMTRADNANRPDALVGTRDVLGKVTSVDGKRFKSRLNDRAGALNAYFTTILKRIARA